MQNAENGELGDWELLKLKELPEKFIATLLDHYLKSLHNTVKHMNLPTVV